MNTPPVNIIFLGSHRGHVREAVEEAMRVVDLLERYGYIVGDLFVT